MPEISWDQLHSLMHQTVAEARSRLCPKPKRVLLLPPDITRMHSGAGRLTEILYNLLKDEAEIHVIPTLGQHVPHTADENRQMFGSIPNERIHAHDWRQAAACRSAKFPAGLSTKRHEAPADWPLPIVLNRMLMEDRWDWIINIGHVVPHEVLGFANHNKNYFIGLGGKELICTAHMAAACCGIENNLGNLVTPVRACFNRAEDEYLAQAARFLCASGVGPESASINWYTQDYTSETIWKRIWPRPGIRARQNITVFDEPVRENCVRHARG